MNLILLATGQTIETTDTKGSLVRFDDVETAVILLEMQQIGQGNTEQAA